MKAHRRAGQTWELVDAESGEPMFTYLILGTVEGGWSHRVSLLDLESGRLMEGTTAEFDEAELGLIDPLLSVRWRRLA